MNLEGEFLDESSCGCLGRLEEVEGGGKYCLEGESKILVFLVSCGQLPLFGLQKDTCVSCSVIIKLKACMVINHIFKPHLLSVESTLLLPPQSLPSKLSYKVQSESCNKSKFCFTLSTLSSDK